MAFKMKGFNAGKGTGSAKSFATYHSASHPYNREGEYDPYTQYGDKADEWREYDKRFEEKHGYSIAPDVIPQSGIASGSHHLTPTTSDNVRDQLGSDYFGWGGDITEQDKINIDNWEHVQKRLKNYKNDPLKFNFELDDEGGFKQPTNADFKNWVKKNKKDLEKEGVRIYKDGSFDRNAAKKIFQKKLSQARWIDTDLKESASKGYGWDADKLSDVLGNIDVTNYKPHPVLAGNIEKSKEEFEDANKVRLAERYYDKAMKYINHKDGPKDIPNNIKKELMARDPEKYYSLIEGYSDLRGGNWEDYQKLREDGVSHEQAMKKMNLFKDVSNKTVSYPTTKGSKTFSQLEGKAIVETDEDQNQIADVNENKEYTDDFTTKMDEDIAKMNQNKFSPDIPPSLERESEALTTFGQNLINEEIAVGGDGNELEETETKEEEFDPKDYNKDGVVDYLDKRMGPPKTNSAYTKWNNKKMEKLTKEINYYAQKSLMNTDRNPHKYDTEKYWDWRNEKSKEKAKKIKSKYNKFL